jgi:hypothetical protein
MPSKEHITHLDGRPLPAALLTPIPPVDVAGNALRYYSNLEPDEAWIKENEEAKLNLLVEHAGWRDEFATRPNRYLATYLLIIDELTPGFPFSSIWKALSESEDLSEFKESLLEWARGHLAGFSIGWPSKRRVGRPARSNQQDLDRLVAIYQIAPGRKMSVKERCRRETRRLLAANRRRSLVSGVPKPSEPISARSLENAIRRIPEAQLELWLVRRLTEIQRAAVAWMLEERKRRESAALKF